MPTPTPEEQLTDRQREVLRLHREGKNPTEIGRLIGISSQGVHGHFRRLVEHGHLEPRSRGLSSGAARFDPDEPFANVLAAIAVELQRAEQRNCEIDEEIAGLAHERAELADTITKLHALAGHREATLPLLP